jgi:phosphoribosylformylglycinamidine cyclo-ligase
MLISSLNVAKLGDIPANEMEHVFNMGLGMVLAVSPYYVDSVQAMIREEGHRCSVVGRAVAGTGRSRYA